MSSYPGENPYAERPEPAGTEATQEPSGEPASPAPAEPEGEPTAPIRPREPGFDPSGISYPGPPYPGAPPPNQPPYQGYPPPPAPPAPAPPAPWGPSGYRPPGGPAPYPPPTPLVPDHPQATTAMILGIVGLVGGLSFCGIGLFVSPFAWALGRSALRDIEAAPGRYGGQGQAQAGMYTGIAGTVILALGVLALMVVALIALLAPSGSGSSI